MKLPTTPLLQMLEYVQKEPELVGVAQESKLDSVWEAFWQLTIHLYSLH